MTTWTAKEESDLRECLRTATTLAEFHDLTKVVGLERSLSAIVTRVRDLRAAGTWDDVPRELFTEIQREERKNYPSIKQRPAPTAPTRAPDTSGEWINTEQAAALLEVHSTTVSSLADRFKLKRERGPGRVGYLYLQAEVKKVAALPKRERMPGALQANHADATGAPAATESDTPNPPPAAPAAPAAPPGPVVDVWRKLRFLVDGFDLGDFTASDVVARLRRITEEHHAT